jgi:hypothetical protein
MKNSSRPVPRTFPAAVGLGCLASLTALALATSGRAQSSLTVGSVPAYPGTVAAVPIGLRQAPGSAVAMQLDLNFDPGKVSLQDALRNERLTNHVVRTRRMADGVERVLVYSLDNAAIPGTNTTVASLQFGVPSTEHISSGALVADHVIIAGNDTTRITPSSTNSGVIFVRVVNLLPDGQAQFFLPSQPDQNYVIQATTNFVSWVNILTNTADGTFMHLLDENAGTYPHRFYRWMTQDGAPAEPARP